MCKYIFLIAYLIFLGNMANTKRKRERLFFSRTRHDRDNSKFLLKLFYFCLMQEDYFRQDQDYLFWALLSTLFFLLHMIWSVIHVLLGYIGLIEKYMYHRLSVSNRPT